MYQQLIQKVLLLSQFDSARVSESDEAMDAGKSPEIMSMLRSRRLSIGATGNATGPDLLKPVKEEKNKVAEVTGGSNNEALSTNGDFVDEYSKAALVIQERFRAKKLRKLSNIVERSSSVEQGVNLSTTAAGHQREVDLTSPLSVDSGISHHLDQINLNGISSKQPTQL